MEISSGEIGSSFVALRALERPAGCGRSAAQERARGRPGKQERAGQETEDADDRDSGAAHCEAERVAERRAEVAALAAERQQQAEGEHEQSRPERADVDEVAAADHQAADDDERERQHEGQASDESLERIADPAADVPAVPAGPEHGGEEEPERYEREPEQFRMLVPPGPLRLRALRLPHARGRARLEHAFRASPRHGPRFDAQAHIPFDAPNRTCPGTWSRGVA